MCRESLTRCGRKSRSGRNSFAYDTIVEEEQRTNCSTSCHSSSPPNNDFNGAFALLAHLRVSLHPLKRLAGMHKYPFVRSTTTHSEA